MDEEHFWKWVVSFFTKLSKHRIVCLKIIQEKLFKKLVKKIIQEIIQENLISRLVDWWRKLAPVKLVACRTNVALRHMGFTAQY